MTEPAAILVVYGVDNEGRQRASRFAARDAELASKAAALLGFRLAWISGETGRAIAAALPEGNVFACSNSFIRPVRKPLFERLAALIDEGVTATETQRGSDDR
jgi:succinylarginine dihydrolase